MSASGLTYRGPDLVLDHQPYDLTLGETATSTDIILGSGSDIVHVDSVSHPTEVNLGSGLDNRITVVSAQALLTVTGGTQTDDKNSLDGRSERANRPGHGSGERQLDIDRPDRTEHLDFRSAEFDAGPRPRWRHRATVHYPVDVNDLTLIGNEGDDRFYLTSADDFASLATATGVSPNAGDDEVTISIDGDPIDVAERDYGSGSTFASLFTFDWGHGTADDRQRRCGQFGWNSRDRSFGGRGTARWTVTQNELFVGEAGSDQGTQLLNKVNAEQIDIRTGSAADEIVVEQIEFGAIVSI